jgi:hypothetical protein
MRAAINGKALGLLASLASLGSATMVAGTVQAQVPRSYVEMSASQGVPQFKDPKTGQIWTPLNVGQRSGPPTPEDLAFDPLSQAVYVKGVMTQRPTLVPLGSVPITAGPTVPIVEIDNPTLSAVPGKRWQVVLYIQNNSAAVQVPLLNCRFTNSGRLVEETHVLVPAVAAGVRGAMLIYGPKVELFVDRVQCAVKSP